jgi:hypothetical protein
MVASKGKGPFHLASSHGGNAPPQYEFLVVPQAAVIDTGTRKVVYVEREPGLFEGVEVELGPRSGDVYPVIRGLQPGDRIAAAGGFLIDAETRLNPAAAATYFGASGGPQPAGRPAAPTRKDKPEPKQAQSQDKVASAVLTPDDLKNVEQLPEADRPLALAQRVCPITEQPLGSMGVPIKITLRGQPVFVCCKGCVGAAKRNPEETLDKLRHSTPDESGR